MSRKFAVTIKGVRANALPKKDVFTKCDSYLVFTWPGKDPKQTAVAYRDYNPQWPDFELQVSHTVVPPAGQELSVEQTTAALEQQFLVVECFAKHSLRKDSLIGVARVSLLILTAGPVSHKLRFRAERAPLESTIEFIADVRCQSVTSVSLSSISCHLAAKPRANYSIKCQLQSNLEEVMTPVCFNTKNPSWGRVEPFYIDGDLVSLLGELVKLRVCSHKNGTEAVEAQCEIRLQKYNTAIENRHIVFREALVSEDGERIGLVEGDIVYHNLPLPCQMQGGLHDTGSILGAAPMLRDSVMFKDMVLELIPSVIAPYDEVYLLEDEYAVPVPEARLEEIRSLVEEVKNSETSLDTDKALEKLTSALDGDPVSRRALHAVGGLDTLVAMVVKCSGEAPIAIPAAQAEGGVNLEGVPAAAVPPAPCDSLATLVGAVAAAVTDEPLYVERICTKDTVQALSSLLAVSEQDEDAAALCNLLLIFAQKDSRTQGMVANCGSIPHIVSLLLHTQNEVLQLTCVTILGSLVFGVLRGDAAVTAMVRNLGGLSKIVGLLRSTNVSIRRECVKVLRFMCQNNELAAADILAIVIQTLGKLEETSANERAETLVFLAEIALASYKQGQGEEERPLQPLALGQEDILSLSRLLMKEDDHGLQQKLAALFYFLARNDENKLALFESVKVENFSQFENTTVGLDVLRRSSQLYPDESVLIDANLPYLMLLIESENAVYREQAQAVLLDSMAGSSHALELILPKLFSSLGCGPSTSKQAVLSTIIQGVEAHSGQVEWERLIENPTNGFFPAKTISELARVAFLVEDIEEKVQSESDGEFVGIMALNCLAAMLAVDALRHEVLRVVKGCLSSTNPLVLERVFTILKKAVRDHCNEDVVVSVMDLTDSIPSFAASTLWHDVYEPNFISLFVSLARQQKGVASRLLIQVQPLLRDSRDATDTVPLRIFEALFCASGEDGTSDIDAVIADDYLSLFLERAIRAPDLGLASLQLIVQHKPAAVATQLEPLLRRELEARAESDSGPASAIAGLLAVVKTLVTQSSPAAATALLGGLLPLFTDVSERNGHSGEAYEGLREILRLMDSQMGDVSSWSVLVSSSAALVLSLPSEAQAQTIDMWYKALFLRMPATADSNAAPAPARQDGVPPGAVPAPGDGGALVVGGAAAGQQEQLAKEKEKERVADGHATMMLELIGASTLLALLYNQDSNDVVEKAREMLVILTDYVRGVTNNVLDQANDCTVFIRALERGHEVLKEAQASSFEGISLVDIRIVLKVITRIRATNVTGLLLHHNALPLTLGFLSYTAPDEDTLRMLKCSAIAAAAALVTNNTDHLYEMPLDAVDMPQIVKFFDSSVYGTISVCSLLKALFFDARRHQQFLEADGFFLLGRAIQGLSSQILNSIEARRAVEQAAHFLVGAAQVSSLRLDIVGDGLIPIMLSLLSVTRVEEILIPVLGFVFFISSEPLARMEMIDTREVDTLMVLMQQRKTFPKLALAAEECFVRLGGITTLCTLSTSNLAEYQEFYVCKTCGLTEGVCARCASVCHKGHTLSAARNGTIMCNCGSSPHCLIKQRPNLRVQVPLRICSFCFTGKNYAQQIWYYCRTCYRNEQKGVCATCASVCHSGHDVRFGSESRFYCDCSDRYGMMCRCREQPQCPPGSIPRKRKPRDEQLLLTTGPTLVDQKAAGDEEEDPEESDDTCIVCMDQPKDALFYKCGHVAACMECACMLKQRKDPCIICREPIAEVIRIFKV